MYLPIYSFSGNDGTIEDEEISGIVCVLCEAFLM